jgi:uncharacterized protein (DUF433 family)
LLYRLFQGYNYNMDAIAHISVDPHVCGGKPCIAGTRIRVWDIHVWHDLQGKSPEEIATDFPQLSLADVYAALAYYLDHQEEVERRAEEDEAFADNLRREQGPTKLDRLKAERGIEDSFSF